MHANITLGATRAAVLENRGLSLTVVVFWVVLCLIATVGVVESAWAAGVTLSVNTPAPSESTTGDTFTVNGTAQHNGNCGNQIKIYTGGGCSGGSSSWQGSSILCQSNSYSPLITMGAPASGACVVYYDVRDNIGGGESGDPVRTNVVKFSQSISVGTPPPASKDGGTNFLVAATAGSGFSVVVSVSGGACTVAGNTVSMTKTSGTCTVNFDQPGNGTWAAAPTKSYNVTATGLAQTITVTTPAPVSAAYNTSFTVAATTNASPSRVVAITTAGSCSGSGSGSATITMTSGSGACTVYYNQADNSPSYAPATQVSSSTSATKLNQTISFPEQSPNSYLFVASGVGSTFPIGPVATSASPNSGNAITYGSLSTGVCTVSGTTVTMVSVGTCVIEARQAGNANYNDAAPQPTQNVLLTKALQKIVVTTHAPGVKVSGGTFSVAAESRAVANNALTGLHVSIQAMGNCTVTAGGSDVATLKMTSSTGICTVYFSQAGDSTYGAADPVTEYVAPDTSGGSGCFGEGTYTSLQFNNSGGYIGWACNNGDYAAPGHNVSCSPPTYLPGAWPYTIFPRVPGWSIKPGSAFKGHVLQTELNPGKTFKIQKAPGAGDYYNILNTSDATCIGSGNGAYESGGTRLGAITSTGYLVAFQDSATLPGKYCDYSADQAKWKMNISGSYVTFATAGYPNWPSHGCIGSESSLALRNKLLDPGNGNYGDWGDSWVRNASPSCSSNGAKIKCGGYQPPPPDHVRFEFDSTRTYTCGAKITIKVCNNPAPDVGSDGTCNPFTGYTVLKPFATKGAWSGLTAAPLTGFTGTSTGIALSHTVVGDAVNLSYSNPSMTLTDSVLECYDTATSKRVSCTGAFVYKTCPPFDAVEKGADVATNLYTRLADTAFEFDVVGASTYTGTTIVDLVDVSGGAAVCPTIPGGRLTSAAFTAPSNSTGAITYTFVGADAGRKTFNASYAEAAANVAVRIIDKDNNCYASTDTFSIRPTQLVLATTLVGSTATAGASFTLTATAKNSGNTTTTAYVGTPTAYDNYIYGWDGANIAGMLAGSFDAATVGVATGNAFKFSGVGALTFPVYTDSTVYKIFDFGSPVGDTSFTQPSGDQTKGDCVANSYSTSLVGGKYGCNIGSTALTLPRFIPDHYEVDNRIAAACGSGVTGATYFGQGFNTPPVASVAAMDADRNQLTNLINTYTLAYRPTFTIEALDGATIVASPATAAPVLMDLTTPFDWPATSGAGGLYVNAASGVVPRPAVPADYEAFGLKTTITDPDGVKITKCNAVDVAGTTSCTSSPTTSMRYGILKLDNAYGSELLPLYVPVRALYWDGVSSPASWKVNDKDSCTQLIVTGTGASLATTIVKGPLTLARLAPTPATLQLVGGIGSLQFAAPGLGFQGSADIAINLGAGTGTADASCNAAHPATDGLSMAWLRGNWCDSSGYAKDPNARINFGTAKSPFIYMRERY